VKVKSCAYIGLFERGDDENKLIAENKFKNKIFIKKIDRFV